MIIIDNYQGRLGEYSVCTGLIKNGNFLSARSHLVVSVSLGA